MNTTDRLRDYIGTASNANGNGHAAPIGETLPPLQPTFRSVRELRQAFPSLRDPLIHGLLRRGETMNVIAPPKAGKSWLVTDLAIALATGRTWLGTFQTTPADVLILDNELHGETSAHRVPKVAEARGVPFDEYADRVCVENLRGQLRDVFSFGSYFAGLEPGRFGAVIIDAFYRAMPVGMDENDNGTMAGVFNQLDRYAADYDLSFILIHHASKGSQAAKSVTDVGAGAGAQSRATDTHLVLRQHEEDGAAVMDAAVRSWAPIEPLCLRWQFPIWTPDTSLDASMLRQDGRGRRRREEEEPAEPGRVVWTAELFAERYVGKGGRTKDEILCEAENDGLSVRKAAQLLGAAVAKGAAFKWSMGRAVKEKYSTEHAPELISPENQPKSSTGRGMP